LTPLGRSRPQRIAGLVVLAEAIAIGFLPLFAGPGYEQAFATGLVAPSAVAVATALDGSENEGDKPFAAAVRGVESGVLAAALALAVAFLHGLRVGACDPLGGVRLFLLGPGVGCVLAGLWGAFAAQLARGRSRRRLAAIALALAAPLGCVFAGVYRFWSSPMIFAFDPFVGYFSGTVYDTVIDPGPAMTSYRLGSLATIVSVLAAARTAEARPGGGVTFRARRGRARLLALAVVAAAVSLGVWVKGASLGHFSTPESIAKELGGKKSGKRCDVVHPATMRVDEVDLLVRDCDEELVAVERSMGIAGPARITAYFFRDAEEKKRLMGAANTYIAKPWREEVYLQLAPYPHPVLGHEIAHVVAGSAGQGPFRVAGAAGGLWPNPGLIEGMAEAAAPDEDEISDAVWTRAMMELGILPSLDRVFGFGFFGEASSKAYTIAGAFVGWARDRFGKDKVLAWYGGAPVTTAFGAPLAALERDFRAHLGALPVSADLLATAKARFARPSIFGRACPHAVDELRKEGDVCRDSGRVEEALRKYGGALALDPADHGSRLSAAQLRARLEDRARGRAELQAISADERYPRTVRDRAEEALGDADWLDGQRAAAAAHYDVVAKRSLDEDMARTMEIKALGARDERLGPTVQRLLLGERTLPPDLLVSGLSLGAAIERSPSDPILRYLEGRNLSQRGRYAEARVALEASLASGAKEARITRETLRVLAVAICSMGDRAGAAALAERVQASSVFAQGSGRRAAVLRLLDRCAR
jgi:tetratricopeptide (TPR) repeat protein